MPKFNVVAVGRAYTDIIAPVSSEFLQNQKIPIGGQRECSTDELKKIQRTLLPSQMVSGGPSANTVAMISSLGGDAGFFGKVYDDEAGQRFLEDLEKRNVDLCCPSFEKAPDMSAICLVLLTDDQRSFAYNPGCADHFSATDFNKFDFSTTDFFLLEAHLLTSSVANPAIVKAIERAKNKTTVVINLQGITQWDNFAEVAQYITSNANIIIGNQEEQTALAQAVNLSKLPQQSSPIVVTTKGADGAEISQSGRVLYQVAAEKPKKFVSSAGAGDAFIAGFLLAQSRGMTVEESMHQATKTATAILEEIGARPTRSLSHLFPTFTYSSNKINSNRFFSQALEVNVDVSIKTMLNSPFSQELQTVQRLSPCRKK